MRGRRGGSGAEMGVDSGSFEQESEEGDVSEHHADDQTLPSACGQINVRRVVV